MIDQLRVLNAQEAARVHRICKASPGSTPEGVIRALARLLGATTWGVLPATTDDVVLDHAGRRLGMLPLQVSSGGLVQRERQIFTHYVRQAWEAAEPLRRASYLQDALGAWDSVTGVPPGPASGMTAEVPEHIQRAVLHELCQTAAGCRCLAAALERWPLSLPEMGSGPVNLLNLAMGVRDRDGHEALFGVLAVLQQSRRRMLLQHRAALDTVARELDHTQSVLNLHDRFGSRAHHWAEDKWSGLAVAAGAGISLTVWSAASMLSPAGVAAAGLTAVVGIVWAGAAGLKSKQPDSNARRRELSLRAQKLLRDKQEHERTLNRLDG